MDSLDHIAQQQVTDLVNATSKAVPAAMAGQLIFGYSINEWAAIIGIVVTVVQFGYWIYEKFVKEK